MLQIVPCSVVVEKINIPDAFLKRKLRKQKHSCDKKDILKGNKAIQFDRNLADTGEMCRENVLSDMTDNSPASSIVPLATTTTIPNMLKLCKPCSVVLYKLDMFDNRKKQKSTNHEKHFPIAERKLKPLPNIDLPHERHMSLRTQKGEYDSLLITVEDFNLINSALPQKQMPSTSGYVHKEKSTPQVRGLSSNSYVPYKLRKHSRDCESSLYPDKGLNQKKVIADNELIPTESITLACSLRNLCDDSTMQEQMSSVQKKEPKHELIRSETNKTSHHNTRSTRNCSSTKKTERKCGKRFSTSLKNHFQDEKIENCISSKRGRKSSLCCRKQSIDTKSMNEFIRSEASPTFHHNTRSTRNCSSKKEGEHESVKKFSTSLKNHFKDEKIKNLTSSKRGRKSSLSFKNQPIDKIYPHKLKFSKRGRDSSTSCQKQITNKKVASSLQKKQDKMLTASVRRKSKKSIAPFQKSSIKNKKTKRKTTSKQRNTSLKSNLLKSSEISSTKNKKTKREASSKQRRKTLLKYKKIMNDCVQSVPIDDLALCNTSRAKRMKSDMLKNSNKSISKRKKMAVAAMKDADDGYQDDIYESKKFDFFQQLNVDTSFSPASSSMSTPEMGCQVSPRVRENSPPYRDFFPPEEYARRRKVAVDCLERRKNQNQTYPTPDFFIPSF